MSQSTDGKSEEMPPRPGEARGALDWDFASTRPAGRANSFAWTDDDFARISGWVRGVSPPTPESAMPDWAKPDFSAPSGPQRQAPPERPAAPVRRQARAAKAPRAAKVPKPPRAPRARKIRKPWPRPDWRRLMPDPRPTMRRVRWRVLTALARGLVIGELIGGLGSAIVDGAESFARLIGGGGRAIRRVSTAWMALLPMAGRAAGSVANAVAVAALRQTRRMAAASGGAWHVLRAGAMSSAAYTAIFARIAFAASARLFSRADMRPVFMRAAALATVAAIVGGIAMTTGPMPGIGIMNVAMRSTAAKPRPVETAMAVPMAEVAAASVPAVEAMPVQVVAGVPLPMPRIAHRPAHHAGRAFASRSAVPERTYADAPARRPMAGSWQPMGGELARSRAFNAPDRIYEAQVRLARLGYPAGPATGLADGQTRYAVALFQRDMRLPMTGDIDGRVLRRLRIADERNSRLADR